MKKPYVEQRPWGQFERFLSNEQCTVKILTINPEQALSLQYHKLRDEFWRVLEGNPVLVIGEQIIPAKPDEEFFIPKETNHRITAGKEQAKILEIAVGQYDENDIVRLKDKYNRPNP